MRAAVKTTPGLEHLDSTYMAVAEAPLPFIEQHSGVHQEEWFRANRPPENGRHRTLHNLETRCK